MITTFEGCDFFELLLEVNSSASAGGSVQRLFAILLQNRPPMINRQDIAVAHLNLIDITLATAVLFLKPPWRGEPVPLDRPIIKTALAPVPLLTTFINIICAAVLWVLGDKSQLQLIIGIVVAFGNMASAGILDRAHRNTVITVIVRIVPSGCFRWRQLQVQYSRPLGHGEGALPLWARPALRREPALKLAIRRQFKTGLPLFWLRWTIREGSTIPLIDLMCHHFELVTEGAGAMLRLSIIRRPKGAK